MSVFRSLAPCNSLQRFLARTFLVFALLLGSGAALGLPGKASAESSIYYTWPPSPSGTVGYAYPSIQMKVKFDGMPLQRALMTLNGASVPVKYDADRSVFVYQPTAPLAPGGYNVKLSLEWKGYEPQTYTWAFSVKNGAVETLPAVTAAHSEALKAVNDIRRQLGLPQVELNGQLNLAAQYHADYQRLNGQITHTETPGKPGFTGASLGERLQYAGYANESAAEDISQQENATPTKAVDDLYDAPYHRMPFLDPALTEIGYAQAGPYHVLLFGFAEERSQSTVVITPGEGDRGVPVSWNGNELPDPLRVHPGTRYPVGYPILLGVYGSGVDKAVLQDAELTGPDGTRVPLLRSSASNDDRLTTQMLLIPQHPLEAGQRYKANVRFQVQYEDGRSEWKEQAWTFATEAKPGAGRLALHGGASVPAAPIAQPRHVFTFGLDASSYTLDGVRAPLLVKPFIRDGISYLAVRDIGQALGASIDWDNAKRAAVYLKDGQKILFYVDRPYYEVNGQAYYTDTPAQLAFRETDNPRTVVPVRLLANLLGGTVDYDDPTRTVRITY
ncbi:hypothetical protein J31TS4_30720 [Paenibacillus sp. J31TS4]|uniref:stalk domain-containing protein n=1 Tax=Paenibacillus sp. J31TS4 TaxID=2807195 RepID=UPI001B01DCC6|nr:stalk domain-containing protein [Paenibacillus sp. J31TS4]GIP39792.1 hypothetical protein J31TS4_30720 [Paenibacillus sp. J31TS4]